MTWNDVVSGVRDALRRGLRRADPEPLADGPRAVPPVDVFESEREWLVRADVPGATRDGAEVTWSDGRLDILLRAPACTWQRTLALPGSVDAARASSSVRDGVLTVQLPKLAGTRSIAVRAR